MQQNEGALYAGVDVGRRRDRTVITVVEKAGLTIFVRGILRIAEMRLPEQQERLDEVLRLPNVRAAKMDMTGIGLGLFEYTRARFPAKLFGVNFGTTVAVVTSAVAGTFDGGPPRHATIRVTEHLATALLQTYEDRAIQHPIDAELRDDLRKPERLVGPTGRVSIAATRDEAGHADHFWSLALAVDAAKASATPTFVKVIQRWKRPLFETRRRGLTM